MNIEKEMLEWFRNLPSTQTAERRRPLVISENTTKLKEHRFAPAPVYEARVRAVKTACNFLDFSEISLSTHVSGYDNRFGCALIVDRTEGVTWTPPYDAVLLGHTPSYSREDVGMDGICNRATIEDPEFPPTQLDDFATLIEYVGNLELTSEEECTFEIQTQIQVLCQHCRPYPGDCFETDCGITEGHSSGPLTLEAGTFEIEDVFSDPDYEITYVTTVVITA